MLLVRISDQKTRITKGEKMEEERRIATKVFKITFQISISENLTELPIIKPKLRINLKSLKSKCCSWVKRRLKKRRIEFIFS